jgi:hypothetical protein
MTADGVLQITTPSGVARTTRPLGLRAPVPDPPHADGAPLSGARVDDESPPF